MSTASPYVELHCHSAYSFLDGVVIGQRERPVPELERCRGELLGQ